MVKISYSTGEETAFVTFSGSAFSAVLETVKRHKFTYNGETKEWGASARKLMQALPHIQDYDDVVFEQGAEEKIKEASQQFGKRETKFKRNKLNERLLKSEPIKGKAPNESFQLDCIQKGINSNRYAFFLGMGSGKTFINISTLNHYFEQGKCDRVLVVTPPEGVYNWRRELLQFATFIDNKDKDIIISSPQTVRDPLPLSPKVIIMTYRHFLTLSDDYHKRSGKKTSKNYRKATIPFDSWGSNRAIILDESHNIKNHKARQSKALHLHKQFFEYRYLLTGTPSPNNFTEVYSQMKFLDSSLVPHNYYEWVDEIANTGNRFSAYAINFIYEKKREEWEQLFAPWVSRFTSNELLDLPDLYIKDTYAALSPTQSMIYEQLINYVISVLKEEDDGQLIPKRLFNKFPYISLAYENASLLKDRIDPVRSSTLASLVQQFKFDKHHGKLSILDSLVTTYIKDEKQKLTIFDFHPSTIEQLAKRYAKYNPIVLHGQNTPKGREAIEWRNEQLEKFKHDPKCNLLIASSKVLQTAVNITQCKRVVYFSRSFSYVEYAQSIKRFHRIGQEDPVIVHNLIFENTIDTRLDKSLKNKKDLDESIFKRESLSKDEWKHILKGEM